MNQTILHTFWGIIMANQVFFTSHEQVKLVGACASFRADISLFIINAEDRERFERIPAGEGIILVAEELQNSVESDELAAIIAHEQGHISCGHLEEIKRAQMTGIINNLRMELEADAFAANAVSQNAMLGGVKKAIKLVLTTVFTMHNVPREDRPAIYRKVAEEMKPRFDALRAAM